jgi:copper homeostasis protein
MPIFEVCAPNFQSAQAAHRAGVPRIELCSAIDVGGITPSPALIRRVAQSLPLRTCVLIRPREGDFCFSGEEVDIMLEDIHFCKKNGAAGVVVGALTPEGDFDAAAMQAMRAAADGLQVVCHRAFDFVRQPEAALEQLIEWGYHRVLSSGREVTAWEGRFFLKKMVEQAAERITVLPGAGISAKNIVELATTTGASEFHFTARTLAQRPADQPIAGLESGYWVSDEAKIRAIIEQF